MGFVLKTLADYVHTEVGMRPSLLALGGVRTSLLRKSNGKFTI